MDEKWEFGREKGGVGLRFLVLFRVGSYIEESCFVFVVSASVEVVRIGEEGAFGNITRREKENDDLNFVLDHLDIISRRAMWSLLIGLFDAVHV